VGPDTQPRPFPPGSSGGSGDRFSGHLVNIKMRASQGAPGWLSQSCLTLGFSSGPDLGLWDQAWVVGSSFTLSLRQALLGWALHSVGSLLGILSVPLPLPPPALPPTCTLSLSQISKSKKKESKSAQKPRGCGQRGQSLSRGTQKSRREYLGFRGKVQNIGPLEEDN